MSSEVQKQLEAPMPWIGMYIAAASLLCTLAMSADVLHGLRNNKLWFPSKYFSLNAASLTLLGVVMKLPVDLTSQMCDVTDRLAKLSSLVFLSTAMANFLPSLGSMENKDILLNVLALGVLVITVTVNVGIQVIQMKFYLHGRLVFIEELLAICCMHVLLVLFCSTALMIPSAKRYMETKYKEMHQVDENKVVASKQLRLLVEKYWVMAETSSPKFMTARSVTCAASGFVGLLSSIILMEAQIRMTMKYRTVDKSDSNYAWSTKWILLTQTFGVIIGTIGPASRWFIAISRSSIRIESLFKVEGYWTQQMVEWKQSLLGSKFRHLKSRKLVHDLRGLILNLCILAQIVTVFSSKLVITVSVSIISPIALCLRYFVMLNMQKCLPNSGSCSFYSKVGVRGFAMMLDGEVELPMGTLQSICKHVDEVIQRGKTENPKDLLKLLHKSSSFNGVKDFDNHQVPFLNSHQDLPYCWWLPVVTLTSIALALPNVKKQKSDNLLKSVAEGLTYVKLVDKNLDNDGGLVNIRTAADVVWLKVELYRKWQDSDLLEISLKGKSSMKILKELGGIGEKTVLEFMTRNARDCFMKNPQNWPANVIAANSMYRISRTVLLMSSHEEDGKTDEELFEQISIMIADILAACLTNLARVITIKCHRMAIEKREKSVGRAAFLLGETEEVIGLLQQRQLPKLLNPNQAGYIEEWRAVTMQDSTNCSHELVSSHLTSGKPKKNHVAIKVDE